MRQASIFPTELNILRAEDRHRRERLTSDWGAVTMVTLPPVGEEELLPPLAVPDPVRAGPF